MPGFWSILFSLIHSIRLPRNRIVSEKRRPPTSQTRIPAVAHTGFVRLQKNTYTIQHPRKAFLRTQAHHFRKGSTNFLDTQNKVETDLVAVAKKFIPQLQGYFQQPPMPQDNTELQNRLRKAAAYFYPRLRACWDFVFGD